MAGGLGSRYKGQKQLDAMGLSGESLMEFSLYDAIRNGFSKIIFVVNSQFKDNNKDYFTKIAEKKNIEIHFVTQEVSTKIPLEYIDKTKHRIKPWGTGHAILCAKEIINEPFIVINADDFYGEKAYQLSKTAIDTHKITETTFQMVGYPIEATLSENGSVSRGICTINENGFLEKVTERTQIEKKEDIIVFHLDNEEASIAKKTVVSMNFWIFHPILFQYLEEKFLSFISHFYNDAKKEFFIPQVIDELIHENKISVNVSVSNDDWFGVTYPEDKAIVMNKVKTLIQHKKYPESLWD